MSSISRLGRSLLVVLAVAGGVATESSAQTLLGRSPGRTTAGPPTAPVNPYGRLFLLPGQKDPATAPRPAVRAVEPPLCR